MNKTRVKQKTAVIALFDLYAVTILFYLTTKCLFNCYLKAVVLYVEGGECL